MEINSALNLTFREQQIITLINDGYTTKEIAELLRVSPYTIQRHRANISMKAKLKGKAAFRAFVRSIK